jgi:3-oxoadipate enol-lactonase/4-carboxymuconolactone decarboxylase
MPITTVEGARLYWRCDGRDDRPALLLANSLGTDHALWEPVLAPLLPLFRVVRYDMRGHGASQTTPGDYSLDRLAKDALAIADAAGLQRFHFAGVSLGGAIGLWLAIHSPERLDRLVASNTAAHFGAEGMTARIAAVKAGGMAAVADAVLARFFTKRFIARGDASFASVRRTLLSLDAAGYMACCAAVRDLDLRASLGRVRAPTLVFAGCRDESTPPEKGREIAGAIPGAEYCELDCTHIPFHEQGSAFVARMLDFLLPPQAYTERARYEVGIARRKQVLGADYVEARLASRHPLTEEFQDFISRAAWGEIWTRPLLDDRTRRLIVLAQLVALRSWEEFDLHARAGLERELSATDIKELLMIAALYCGVPAANTGFAHAQRLVDQT